MRGPTSNHITHPPTPAKKNLKPSLSHVCVQIRKKMVEIMAREAGGVDVKDLVAKFIPEAIGKDIEKACQGGWVAGWLLQRRGGGGHDGWQSGLIKIVKQQGDLALGGNLTNSPRLHHTAGLVGGPRGNTPRLVTAKAACGSSTLL